MAALRLSVRPPAGRVTRVVHGLLLAGLIVGGLLAFRDYFLEPARFLLSHPPERSAGAPGWGQVLFSAFCYGVGGLVLPVMFTLYAIRVRATLDGTVLTVRGIVRTRRVDLARAYVHGETTDRDDGTAEVHLVATAMDGSDEVWLELGTSAGILPSPQLAALADAIAAGGLEGEKRRTVVERLRLFVRLHYAVPRYLWADPPPLPEAGRPLRDG